MIPIISISTFFIAIVMFFIAMRKFYIIYRKTGERRIGYMYKGFLYMGWAMLILSLPGLVLKDLKLIDIANDLYIVFLLVGQAYLINITFDILSWERVKKIVFWAMVASGFFISLVSILNWNSAEVGYQSPFIFWEDTRGVTINLFMGILFMISSIWFSLFFFWNGFKSKEKFVRIRAFLMAIGMFFFLLLGAVDYVLGATPDVIYLSLYTALVGLIATLFFLAAIYYKKEDVKKLL